MTTVLSSQFKNLAVAISAYADAARDDAANLVSTAIVGSDARITDAGENYTGTLRWLSYNGGDQANQMSETATTETLNLLGVQTETETYIKNIDAVAAEESSIQSIISKVDGLSYLGRQFGAVRARREDANLRAVIRGISHGLYTAATSGDEADVINKFGYITKDTAGSLAELFKLSDSASPVGVRSDFFDNLLNAMSAVSGEFEEPFYYLAVSAATYNVLRKENVFDADRVQDGNLSFNTLLGGKIRLLVTGNADGVTNGFDISATVKTSVLMKAGALAYQGVAVPNPTAIDNNPLAGNGAGKVTIVSRWGNIIHPRGYSFGGTASTTAYPNNTTLATAGSWVVRPLANVNQTGIFPIFHG
ncbi:MAG: hypothetical protein ACR2M7_02955 [Bdellovibrionales bacterium]